MDEIKREDNDIMPEDKAEKEVALTREETVSETEKKEPEKKKGKAGLIVTLIIIFLIVAAALTFITIKFIMPSVNYNKALSLMDEGKYAEAAAVFEKLGDYKDSSALINTCYLKNIGDDFYTKITKAKSGDTIKFGSYEQDNNEKNGKEPIEWRVVTVDGKNVMLLSKKALFSMQFCSELKEVTWETSDIRKYLNSDFYKDAFSEDERKLIPTVNNEVGYTPYNTTLNIKATKDKVFLLNITDAESYFSKNEERKCFGTAWAYANGLGANKDGTCWWWTRTSGGRLDLACCVYGAGTYTLWGVDVNREREGVRPVIWIQVD